MYMKYLLVLVSLTVLSLHQNVYGQGTERKVAWFMCVGSSQEVSYMLFLQAALESGLQTSGDLLYPIILIGRNPKQIPDWLIAMNRTQTALVINHNTTFEQNISVFARDKALSVHGAYLRLDMPFLIGRFAKFLPRWGIRLRTDVALYTDCDVMVLNVKEAVVPSLIAIGPEVHKRRIFNTGVLFMNISAFSAARPGLLSYANQHQWVFGGCDQGLINEYFGDQRSLLADEYNWKPYWGINEKARVVHFHGPKFGRCAECLIKHRFLAKVNYTSLCGCNPYNKAMMVSRKLYGLTFDQQMESYVHYLQLFYQFLNDFGKRLKQIEI